jgi:hypothetical protein
MRVATYTLVINSIGLSVLGYAAAQSNLFTIDADCGQFGELACCID